MRALDDQCACADHFLTRLAHADGDLRRLPTGPIGALLSPLARPLMLGVVETVWRGRAPADTLRSNLDACHIAEADDMSVGAFVRSRVNAHTADNLVDPLVGGIWSGNVNRLSVWSCFPALPSAEARSTNGSFVRGIMSSPRVPAAGVNEARPPKWLHRPPIDDAVVRTAMTDRELVGSTFTFRHGLQTLPEALLASLRRLENVSVRLETPVSELAIGAHCVTARVGDRQEQFDKVFWASSSHALSASLGAQAPPALSADLCAIEYASVAIVHIAFNRDVLPMGYRGFGFLVPSSEHLADASPEVKLALDGLLGVTFDSITFPEQNFSPAELARLKSSEAGAGAAAASSSASPMSLADRASSQLRLTVMLGGARFPHIATLPPSEWEARARAVVRHLLHIDAEPDAVRAHCARDCIPQPNVGHTARMRRVHGALSEVSGERIHLLGMVNGVSMPDCITNACRSATQYASEMLKPESNETSIVEGSARKL